MIEVDVLVVGAGPAGAATAVFLCEQGIRTLMISRQRGTAETPRAHITNQRTMETLRNVGLERKCLASASPSKHIEHSFWLRSMTGEELARTWSWGNDPKRIGDYAAASPCSMNDLPQTQLEPILVTEAARLGCEVRFGWELVDFEQDEEGVTARVVDRLSNQVATVRAQYMVGADGARSRVVEQLGLPLVGMHGLGTVFNVLCDVDLSGHLADRHGSLYSVIQPGSSYWAPVAVFRMVRPWDQWLVGLIVPQAVGKPEPTIQDFEQRIRELIGDDELKIQITNTSAWTINDVHAERFSEGRVFCAGDAVHRHPPTNGLGSNTCVQDAFNLAWKLAYVIQGRAGRDLLESYNAERQPIGKAVVARANKSFLQNNKVWDLLGGGTLVQMAPGEQTAIFETASGREILRTEIDRMKYEYHAHGVEMNRDYSSLAVVGTGAEKFYNRDPELYYQPSTVPGSSLPHVWLNHRQPSPRTSTLDIAGGGQFVLFTGAGGEGWREAANAVKAWSGVEIKVVTVGPYLNYEDTYGTWAALSEVEESGCVLARPDLIVGWRCVSLPEDPADELGRAMAQVLQVQAPPKSTTIA